MGSGSGGDQSVAGARSRHCRLQFLPRSLRHPTRRQLRPTSAHHAPRSKLQFFIFFLFFFFYFLIFFYIFTFFYFFIFFYIFTFFNLLIFLFFFFYFYFLLGISSPALPRGNAIVQSLVCQRFIFPSYQQFVCLVEQQ